MPKRVSPFIAMKRLVEAGAAYPYPSIYHDDEKKAKKSVNQIQKDLIGNILSYMFEHHGEIPTSRHLNSLAWRCGFVESRWGRPKQEIKTSRSKMINRAVKRARKCYHELTQ